MRTSAAELPEPPEQPGRNEKVRCPFTNGHLTCFVLRLSGLGGLLRNAETLIDVFEELQDRPDRAAAL